MRTTRRTRMYAIVIACSVLLSTSFLLSGCAPSASSTSSDTQQTQLIVSGSTTVLPIAEIAGEKFQDKTGVHVLVSGLGSSAGIQAAIDGTAHIGTSSRKLTKQEAGQGLQEHVIAHDGIAVIVNPQNPCQNISLEQLRDIYAGKITNWKQLGGNDQEIQVVNRDEASGTREAFKTIVMQKTSFNQSFAVLPGTGQVRDVVAHTPGAIGYISIGFVASENNTAQVKALRVNDIEPTEQNVLTKTYPISRDLYFFTKGEPQGSAQEYLDFVTSSEMAQTIRDAGYIPVTSDEKGVSNDNR